MKKHTQNDYKRLIKTTGVTLDGKVADKTLCELDEIVIAPEQMYDGFYAVCTNVKNNATEIAKINHKRWEIKECFRIMKTDFKAKPVYLKGDNRNKATYSFILISHHIALSITEVSNCFPTLLFL